MRRRGHHRPRRSHLLAALLVGIPVGAILLVTSAGVWGNGSSRSAQASDSCPTDPFQSGSIFGQVISQDTQQPVPNALVGVIAEESFFNASGNTAFDGSYQQLDVPFGPYTISAVGSLAPPQAFVSGPGFSDPIEVCVQGDATAPQIVMRIGVVPTQPPPPPTPSPGPGNIVPQGPRLVPNGRNVRASISVMPASATYSIGQQVMLCVSTPPGSYYTITDTQQGVSQYIDTSSLSDTGGCFSGTISPPPGPECVRLVYVAPFLSGSTQVCWQVTY